MRGGTRPGAGRPKGTTKDVTRTNRTLKAYDDEWEAIKIVAKAIKKSKENMDEILKLCTKLDF